MNQVAVAVERYFDDVAAAGIGFVNEAEMQHELAYWLRSRLPKGATLHFERPARYFVEAVGLVKKEIDLVLRWPMGTLVSRSS